MSDWTPEDVDALFQEGSEKHEFEYNEAAWGQMEDLLDRRDKRRRLIWWWFLGIGLSLLVFAIYWGQNRKLGNDTNTEENVMLEQPLSTSIDAINTTAQTPLTERAAIKAEKTTGREKKNVEKQSFENTLTTKESQVAENQSTTNTRQTVPIRQNKEVATELKRTEQNIDLLITPEQLLTKKEETLDLSKKVAKEITEEIENRSITSSTLAALPRLSNIVDIPNDTVHFDLTFLENTGKEKKHRNNHFVFGVLVASEASFVETSTLCSPTWKAGLSLAYRFGGKHALKLGANYIRKDYATNDAANYRAPQGFWENGVAPQSVTANCDILELTLSESFFFKGHTQKGFYANIGLTSYLMLEEIYNYSYENPPSNARMRWGTQNTNQHWMGIGEIALGYNFPFADKSSLQIAPYAQIPLTGVGHGQLKLFSSGVLVRYNFHVR